MVGGRDNLGYQYVMRQCIKVVSAVKACLNVCCELEDGRCSLGLKPCENFVDRG